jgi:hypothetical protein
MNKHSSLKPLLTSILLTLACSSVYAASSNDPALHTGTETVKLSYVQALSEAGTPMPTMDASCKQFASNYVGMPVKTQYSIDTETLIMQAQSSFPSPQKTQPLELSVKLNALGIAGSYDFASYRPAVVPGLYAVIFNLNKDFTNAVSSMLLFGPEGLDYNCLVSSSADTDRSMKVALLKK